MRTFKHLSWEKRLQIEALLKAGHTACEIADQLGVHNSTIYREIKRGQYEHLNGDDYTTEMRYSPDIAHEQYRVSLAAKGPPLKIGNDFALADHIERKIVEEHYSPAAVLGEIERTGLKFSVTISTGTVYNYIYNGVFMRVSIEHLPEKGKRKKPKPRHIKRQARAARGESIENRPKEIDDRETFGHWEMDCVEGKQGTKRTLLVLSERAAREQIIIPMKDQTARSVVQALDRIERKTGALFPEIFKTITVDNGSEFSDVRGIERSKRRRGKRTRVFYCHPYSAYERGTNENSNRLIRRWFPKGTDFTKIPNKEIKRVEEWMNNYPRGIFNYHTAREKFEKHLEEIKAH